MVYIENVLIQFAYLKREKQMPEKWPSLMRGDKKIKKVKQKKNTQKNVRKFIQNKVLPHFVKNF